MRVHVRWGDGRGRGRGREGDKVGGGDGGVDREWGDKVGGGDREGVGGEGDGEGVRGGGVLTAQRFLKCPTFHLNPLSYVTGTPYCPFGPAAGPSTGFLGSAHHVEIL